MDTGNWISLLMAVIATGSVAITYTIYRSATDPEVIVYADPDRKRPSVINLIIKNIGNGPATEVSFETDRPLPDRAFSIEIPDDMPSPMVDGPLVVGVPYLAPGQELVVTWGQYGGLKKFIGTNPIQMTIKFKRARVLTQATKFLESGSLLDIESFAGTDSSDHNWGEKLVKEIDKTNKQLGAINSSISNLSGSRES